MSTLTKHIGDTLQATWSGASPRTSDLLTLRDAGGSIAFGPNEGILNGAAIATWSLTGGTLAPGQTYSSQRVITSADGQVQQAMGPDVAIAASLSPSQPAQNSQSPLLLGSILTHLVGLDGWLAAAATSRAAFGDTAILALVQPAIKEFERETQFRVSRVQVVTRPDDTFPSTPDLPLLIESPHAFDRQSADAYFQTTLKWMPVETVQRVRVFLGQEAIFEYPPDWFGVDGRSGRFFLLPFYGGVHSLPVTAANGYAAFMGVQGSSSIVPLALAFDYIAGLPNTGSEAWWVSPEWADLTQCLEKCVALAVLKKIAHLADAGLISANTQGDTRQYSRFADRKAELMADITAFKETLEGTETGMSMAGV